MDNPPQLPHLPYTPLLLTHLTYPPPPFSYISIAGPCGPNPGGLDDLVSENCILSTHSRILHIILHSAAGRMERSRSRREDRKENEPKGRMERGGSWREDRKESELEGRTKGKQDERGGQSSAGEEDYEDCINEAGSKMKKGLEDNL